MKLMNVLIIVFLIINTAYADWNETITNSYSWENLDINTSRLISFSLFALGLYLVWVSTVGRNPDTKENIKKREEGI